MRTRQIRTFTPLILAALLSVFVASSSAQSSLERIKRATVFVYQAATAGNSLIVTCVSTGTLISATV